MLDEPSLRHADFLPGTPVRLADGQDWVLPPPPDRADPRAAGGRRAPDAEYEATVSAVADSEGEIDRLRNELALAICLLSRNYDLAPEGLAALLSFAPGDPALIAQQRAMRRVALEHVRGLRGRTGPGPDREPGGEGARRIADRSGQGHLAGTT